MKKLCRLFLMCGCLFLVSGCTIHYNLTIDKDLKVTEEITATEPKSFYEQQMPSNSNEQTLVTKLFTTYQYNNDFEDYTFQYVTDDEKAGAKATRKFNSVAAYTKASSIVSDTESSLKLEETRKEVKLSGKANYDVTLQNPIYTEFDEIHVNIKVASPVIENNADEVKNDTYTWILTPQKKQADILLKFENEKKYPSKVPWLLIVIVVVGGAVGFYIVQKQNQRSNRL